jgi:hypothetical protein
MYNRRWMTLRRTTNFQLGTSGLQFPGDAGLLPDALADLIPKGRVIEPAELCYSPWQLADRRSPRFSYLGFCSDPAVGRSGKRSLSVFGLPAATTENGSLSILTP